MKINVCLSAQLATAIHVVKQCANLYCRVGQDHLKVGAVCPDVIVITPHVIVIPNMFLCD